MTPFHDASVQAAFDVMPQKQRTGLLKLRDLIFETAAGLPEVPTVTETLKWGQPSYVTPKGIGSTIRLACPKTGGFAIYAHCQTSIIKDFAEAYPGWDQIEGTRAVVFNDTKQIDPVRHGALIGSALTYHLNK